MIVTPAWRDKGLPDAEAIRARHREFEALLWAHQTRGRTPGQAWLEARRTQALIDASRHAMAEATKVIVTFADKMTPVLQDIANKLGALRW